MKIDLTGKRAVVSGSTAGIGLVMYGRPLLRKGFGRGGFWVWSCHVFGLFDAVGYRPLAPMGCAGCGPSIAARF